MGNTSHAISALIADSLEKIVGQHRFNMWFDRSAKLAYLESNQSLEVAVPNRLVAEWIDKNFKRDLLRAAGEVLDQQIQVQINTRIAPELFNNAQGDLTPNGKNNSIHQSPVNNRQTKSAAQVNTISNEAMPTTATAMPISNNDASSPEQHQHKQIASANNINDVNMANSSSGRSNVYTNRPTTATAKKSSLRSNSRKQASLRHSLKEFVVGPSNELAYNAAQQLLLDEERAGANPLFIHGGVGLGKTHLLQGMCQQMRKNHPDARVLYTTGEQFTNEFLTAMRTNKLDSFRRRIRGLDLLAIDDVHFLAGKEKSQQEFLHSFDEIDLSGARLVLASDNHPKLIKAFSAALVNRCVRGLVVEVKSPNTATRMRIVRALADRRGISLLDTVIALLASRFDGSVRDIEGMLAKLQAMSNLFDQRTAGGKTVTTKSSQPIGHAIVNRMFESETSQPRRPVQFEQIVDNVSEQLQISRAKIMGSLRIKAIVLARSLVIYLARQMTSMSYPEITAAMNRSSHSTVIAADRRISTQMTDQKHVSLPGDLDGMPITDLVDRLKHAILRKN